MIRFSLSLSHTHFPILFYSIQSLLISNWSYYCRVCPTWKYVKQVTTNENEKYCNYSKFNMWYARFEILVNTDISILGFYRYIGNIGEISLDILTKISIRQIIQNSCKYLEKLQKMIKWIKIHKLKLFFKCNWHRYG